MVKKEVKKHSFLKEEPILFGGNEDYIVNGDIVSNFGVDNNITLDANPFRLNSIRLNNNTGDPIFVVNENEIVWRGQTLVTEERVREIVEEQMRELGLI
jgi:hypothetical protein